MKSERNFPPSTHQSEQLKSMEAQTQIKASDKVNQHGEQTANKTVWKPVHAIIVRDPDT